MVFFFNVEIFTKFVFEDNICERKWFGSILFLEMEFSKLTNYFNHFAFKDSMFKVKYFAIF